MTRRFTALRSVGLTVGLAIYIKCFIWGDLNVHLDDKAFTYTPECSRGLYMTHDCARQLGHIHNHQLDVKFVMHDDCQSLTLTIQV